MPEACFLCLDSTEYMRNGDQFPNRLMAEQEAANLLVNAKMQANAENTVGFLTTGGAACTVYETLTPDVERVMATLTRIPIEGKTCHFSSGLLIASLALSHRTNPRAEKRIVAFVASPLRETEKELETLAKKLRKDDVAVDVVAFGVEENIAPLEAFVEKVNKAGNSRFLSVSSSENLTDALMGNAILIGAENVAGAGGGGAESPVGGLGFDVDPNVDPELAMALRMSMEEELQRQSAAAQNSNNAAGGESNAAPAPVPAPTSTANEEDLANLSEEEMLQRALAMSMEEATAANQQSAPPAEQGDANEEEETEGSKEAKNPE